MRDGVVPVPLQNLTLSESHEETLPPPHRSPSLPPAVHSTNYIGIIPASHAKRKHNFELIIEAPSKKFKPSRCPPPSSSFSGGPTTSSSHSVPDKSVTTATRSPAREYQTGERNVRNVAGGPFKVVLDPQVRDVTVSRDFMRTHFGARSTRSFCQLSEPHVDRHGYDHFAFVSEVNLFSLLAFIFG